MTANPELPVPDAAATPFWERAEKALRLRWPTCRITSFDPFTAGTSSLTYGAGVVAASVSRVVVKVAPPGLEPVRNRDVLRQARFNLQNVVPQAFDSFRAERLI